MNTMESENRCGNVDKNSRRNGARSAEQNNRRVCATQVIEPTKYASHYYEMPWKIVVFLLVLNDVPVLHAQSLPLRLRLRDARPSFTPSLPFLIPSLTPSLKPSLTGDLLRLSLRLRERPPPPRRSRSRPPLPEERRGERERERDLNS